MSQSAVYVQAIDGLLYKNPLIYGEGWFICFDDDEPPEIVMKKFHNTTVEAARRRADLLLREAGMGFELHKDTSMKSGRSFPPTWKPKDAASIFFTLLSPIPIPRSYGGVRISPAKVDASMYIFWHDFDTRAVLETILGLEFDNFLLESQRHHQTDTFDPRSLASMVKAQLVKQLPELKDVTIENYEKKLLAFPKKLRVKWRLSSSATADSGG